MGTKFGIGERRRGNDGGPARGWSGADQKNIATNILIR